MKPEIAFRSTIQLITHTGCDENRCIKSIKRWGSGFFFKYDSQLFLITAGHLPFGDDFDNGDRIWEGDFTAIILNGTTKCKGELKSPLYNLSTPVSLDEYNVEPLLKETVTEDDVKLASIGDMIDISIFPIGNELFNDFKEQLDKEIIDEIAVVSPNIDDKIIFAGTVNNRIENGIQMKCDTVYYDSFILTEQKTNGQWIAEPTNGQIVYDCFAGLSGAPVFTQDNKIIGMLIEVNENNNTIIIEPIQKIIRLLKPHLG